MEALYLALVGTFLFLGATGKAIIGKDVYFDEVLERTMPCSNICEEPNRYEQRCLSSCPYYIPATEEPIVESNPVPVILGVAVPGYILIVISVTVLLYRFRDKCPWLIKPLTKSPIQDTGLPLGERPQTDDHHDETPRMESSSEDTPLITDPVTQNNPHQDDDSSTVTSSDNTPLIARPNPSAPPVVDEDNGPHSMFSTTTIPCPDLPNDNDISGNPNMETTSPAVELTEIETVSSLVLSPGSDTQATSLSEHGAPEIQRSHQNGQQIIRSNMEAAVGATGVSIFTQTVPSTTNQITELLETRLDDEVGMPSADDSLTSDDEDGYGQTIADERPKNGRNNGGHRKGNNRNGRKPYPVMKTNSNQEINFLMTIRLPYE